MQNMCFKVLSMLFEVFAFFANVSWTFYVVSILVENDFRAAIYAVMAVFFVTCAAANPAAEKNKDDNSRDRRTTSIDDSGIVPFWETHHYNCVKCQRSFKTEFELEEGPTQALCDDCNDCELRISREIIW